MHRRHFLQTTGFGFGAIAAADLLKADGAQTSETPNDLNPLAQRQPHFPAKIRRVIHLFMNGGPSQIDTFDPKPGLIDLNGKPLPDTIKERLQPVQRARVGNIFASPFEFQKHGESGLDISELFPQVAQHADRLCVIRSMTSEIANHSPGLLMMNCGHTVLERPSIGSWVLYGLGSESDDLPGYIVLMPSGLPTAQAKNWTSAFLPGLYQGTHIETAGSGELIPDLTRKGLGYGNQRAQLALTQYLNERHLRSHPGEERLESRINSMELAFRMQTAATDAFDLSDETKATREAYGDTPVGNNLLLARRLSARSPLHSVLSRDRQPWDSHSGLVTNHKRLCRESDQPIAALLRDLQDRGLWDETLVIWGGEMGRTSTYQGTSDKPSVFGRDHHVDGFTVWLSGGAVKGGTTYGATDEFGLGVSENPVPVHDLHATILHLFGLDHKRLTYRYSGRDFRLTDIHGHVVEDLLA
ncbi:MAG: DUF1501 domain-containing protein [Planctomycetaceae bacterium]